MRLIRQRNEDLVTLANGGRNSISTAAGSFNSPTISRSVITYHQQVQRHARLLYSVLREKLEPPKCKCGVPHSTHLELKMRSTPPTKALSKPQTGLGPNQCFTFSLIFSKQKSSHDQLMAVWQEFQFEPINDYSCREAPGSTFCGEGPAAVQRPPSHTMGVVLSPSPSSGSPSLPLIAPTPERGRSMAPPHILSPSPMP